MTTSRLFWCRPLLIISTLLWATFPSFFEYLVIWNFILDTVNNSYGKFGSVAYFQRLLIYIYFVLVGWTLNSKSFPPVVSSFKLYCFQSNLECLQSVPGMHVLGISERFGAKFICRLWDLSVCGCVLFILPDGVTVNSVPWIFLPVRV